MKDGKMRVICLVQNDFFDLMLSLENDKMTALWPNVSYTFAFFSKFSDKIPNWAIFAKEVLWFDA